MQGDNKGFLVCKKKMATSADLLCRYTPPAFRQFTEAVVNLKFDEEPRYSAYVPLFEPLCGPGPQRPILLEEKSRVGQKRGREAFEGEDMEIVSCLALHWRNVAPIIFPESCFLKMVKSPGPLQSEHPVNPCTIIFAFCCQLRIGVHMR